MAVVGYLLKLKRDLGLAFNTPSIDKILMLYHFFFSFNTISIDIVSISYLFFFSRYQKKFVIKSLFSPSYLSPYLFLFNLCFHTVNSAQKETAEKGLLLSCVLSLVSI